MTSHLSTLWENVNLKRWMWTAFAVFFWIALSDMAIHGWWLAGLYQETASMWRSSDEMQSMMGWMWSGQFLTSMMLTFIFAKGYEGKGWSEGARFGLLIGLFTSVQLFIQYSVMPMPSTLLWSWFSAGLFQALMGGIIASWVYKK